MTAIKGEEEVAKEQGTLGNEEEAKQSREHRLGCKTSVVFEVNSGLIGGLILGDGRCCCSVHAV